MAQVADGTYHAFVYRGSRLIDLRRDGKYDNSRADGVNSAGEVVGTGDDKAFLYTGGRFIDLNALGRYRSSRAIGINQVGQVVGVGDGTRPFLYSDGKITDLSDLLPPGSGKIEIAAGGFNDRGQIVGAYEVDGERRALLLTPAPRLPGGGAYTFAETGKTVRGVFLTYWQAHGALPIYSSPLTEAMQETLEDGKIYIANQVGEGGGATYRPKSIVSPHEHYTRAKASAAAHIAQGCWVAHRVSAA